MKFLCYGKIKDIENKLKKFNIVEKDPEVILCFGGDGTFLNAIHKFGLQYKYLFINRGHLGFLSNVNFENLNPEKIDWEASEYPIMELNNSEEKYLVVNECRIINLEKIIKIKININNEEIFLKASGIDLVTGIGSTGCSIAHGGIILNPKEEFFSLNPIFSLNNHLEKNINNPLLLNYKDNIKITILTDFYVYIDGKKRNFEGNQFEIKMKKIKMINSPFKKYYHHLIKKMY